MLTVNASSSHKCDVDANRIRDTNRNGDDDRGHGDSARDGEPRLVNFARSQRRRHFRGHRRHRRSSLTIERGGRLRSSMTSRSSKPARTWSAVSALMVLAACGACSGGSGGGSNAATTTTPTTSRPPAITPPKGTRPPTTRPPAKPRGPVVRVPPTIDPTGRVDVTTVTPAIPCCGTERPHHSVS